ncbi:MAG: zinc ABC transporter substrate-binding protein [Pirellulales bacterium]|nr:zinc ABC transporter substrate-binding protein [Pirellulales bacterium]
MPGSLSVAFLGTIVAVLGSPSPVLPAPVVVFVSVPPQASLVRDIGGPHVVVHCLVEAGQDPHVFEPTPKQMLALAHAKVFFGVGIPFERPLLNKIHVHLPDLRIVDSSRGFTRRPAGVGTHKHEDHRRDPHHVHGSDESELDPHIWLSPEGLRIMARNMADSLGQVDPAHAADFRRRLKTVHESIDKADARVRAKLATYRGQTVYVFHPAFGYYCEAYGLKQKAVEVDDKPPTSRRLRELIRQAKKDRARTVFVQAQFDQQGAKVVAEAIGGRIAVVDPLAEDVIANLERIADAIVAGLGKK